MDKADGYRRFFGNAFSLGIGENEIVLSLGFHQPPKPADQMIVEADVVLTHKTMKLLAYNFMSVIDAWEKFHGPINIEADKLESFAETITTQMEAQAALQTARASKKPR